MTKNIHHYDYYLEELEILIQNLEDSRRNEMLQLYHQMVDELDLYNTDIEMKYEKLGTPREFIQSFVDDSEFKQLDQRSLFSTIRYQYLIAILAGILATIFTYWSVSNTMTRMTPYHFTAQEGQLMIFVFTVIFFLFYQATSFFGNHLIEMIRGQGNHDIVKTLRLFLEKALTPLYLIWYPFSYFYDDFYFFFVGLQFEDQYIPLLPYFATYYAPLAIYLGLIKIRKDQFVSQTT